MVKSGKAYVIIDLQESMKNIDNIRKNMEKKGLPVSQLDALFEQLQGV